MPYTDLIADFHRIENDKLVHNSENTATDAKMDQTVDILGLCSDTVGYSKDNDVENQRNNMLESNWTTNGIGGLKSNVSEDKKPLVSDTKVQSSALIEMPKTKMEFLRILGMLSAIIFSILLLYIIFTNRNKGKRR